MNPYWVSSDGRLVIYHGDCREIVPTIDTAGMLVLADPPYGINHPTNYGERGRAGIVGRYPMSAHNYSPVYNDDSPFDPRWLLDIGAARILWGANYYAHLLPPQSGWLVWDKERPDSLDQSTCELAWTDCVKGVRRFRHLWHGMARPMHEPFLHPTQKPVELAARAIGNHDAKTVADYFVGSASTIVAAEQTGRLCRGIEIAPKYVAVALERLSGMGLEPALYQ